MVLSAHTHSPTSWAEPNAIYSMNVGTAMHVQPQVTLGNTCACPGRFISPAHRPSLQVYISGSRYANILQFFTQGTTPAKVNT